MKIYSSGWICGGCGYTLTFLNSREELPPDVPRTMECRMNQRCPNYRIRVHEPVFEALTEMPTRAAAVASYLTAK